MASKEFDDKKKLNAKEKEFVLNYLALSQNATKAYLKTYPNANYGTASTQSSRMLEKPKIKEAISKELKKVWDKKEEQIAKLFQKLIDASGADIGDFLDEYGDIKTHNFNDLNTFLIDSYSKSVSDTKEGQNVRMTIKMVDKLKAIQELTKILGMITDKVEVNVNYDKEKAKELHELFHGKTK